MPDRFPDIEASSLGPQSLDVRLKTYPELRAKIETMLSIIENAGGDRKEKNALLVHTARENRRNGDDLHPRPPRAGDAAVFGVGGR